MAIPAYDASAHRELKDPARSIETGQIAEIERLNAWLASWYGLRVTGRPSCPRPTPRTGADGYGLL